MVGISGPALSLASHEEWTHIEAADANDKDVSVSAKCMCPRKGFVGRAAQRQKLALVLATVGECDWTVTAAKCS